VAGAVSEEVELDAGEGMPEPCALALDSLRTVPQAMLVDRLARLSRGRMRELCAAAAPAPGC
jgi:mRNA-degrading endonuclease toxin of MazEF toxin-antitoxin module